MEKIRVFVAEDSQEFTEKLLEEVREHKELEIVGTACNGLEALRLIRLAAPDVLVLDLVMPCLDGFAVLRELNGCEKRPAVLAVTAMTREDVVSRAMGAGCDYCLLKPVEPAIVADRIVEMVMPGEAQKGNVFRKQNEITELDNDIADIFLSMGIPAHIKGYHFLREAIKQVISDRDKINAITKDLYPSVAGRFSTTSSKVERAIRHAIDVAWNRGQMENLNMLFGSHFGLRHDKPTNGEFIALIADRLSIRKSA